MSSNRQGLPQLKQDHLVTCIHFCTPEEVLREPNRWIDGEYVANLYRTSWIQSVGKVFFQGQWSAAISAARKTFVNDGLLARFLHSPCQRIFVKIDADARH